MSEPLKYFLGSTIEEAKYIHDTFVKVINNIAREYSLRTGIEKTELFNESFLALRKAIENYNPEKGEFYPYAIVVINNSLKEYLKTTLLVTLPVYVRRATSLLYKIDTILFMNNYEQKTEEYVLDRKSVV